MIDDRLKVYASERETWRLWLAENHSKAKEAWLVFYKKGTGKPSVSYNESPEEALCFGWVDGLKRRIDDEKYAYRFSPRKAVSKWSPRNIEIAEKMITEKKMTQAGLEAFKRRKIYDNKILQAIEAKEIPLTSETETLLKANEEAWINFNKLAPSHRKQYILWIQTAKRPETRKKRLIEAIQLLVNNEKLGMR